MWSAVPVCSLCLTKALSFLPASLAFSKDCWKKANSASKWQFFKITYSSYKAIPTSWRSPRAWARQLSSIKSFTFFSRIFIFSSGLNKKIIRPKSCPSPSKTKDVKWDLVNKTSCQWLLKHYESRRMHTCLHSLSLMEGLVLLIAPGDQTLSLEIQTIKMKEIVIFFTNSGVKMYESNIIMRQFISISSKMCLNSTCASGFHMWKHL